MKKTQTVTYYIMTDNGNVKVGEFEALNMIMFGSATVWHETEGSCILKMN